MVTLKINDIEVTVEEGTNIIEAAREIGVQIPHFCYHPGLSLSGTCRLCYVEIKGVPKLQIGCNTPVKEGMEVYTEAPSVIEERKAILEFLLLNHPLDCPICDKGGECPLQDYTLAHGPGKSRFEFQKTTRYKRRPLSDKIIFDPERCVLCLRCTRFTEEITGTNELWVKNRGNRKEISLFENRPLRNNFQGNLPDICPVGALTSADFRFRARVWELYKTESICNMCSVGCNIITWNRKNEVMRLTPRTNMDVNEWWLCDKGRYGYHYINSEDRVTRPHIRENGRLTPVSWEEALKKAADGLLKVKQDKGASALGGVCSPRCSNEDAYLFQKLMRGVFQTDNIDNGFNSSKRTALDHIRSGGRNMTSLSDIDEAEVIIVFDENLIEDHPVLGLRIRKAVTRKKAKLITICSGPTELDLISTQKLNYSEGTGNALLMGLIKSLVKEPPVPARLKEVALKVKNLTLEKVARETEIPEKEISKAAELWGSAKNRVFLFNYQAADDALLDTLDFFSTIMGAERGQAYILLLGRGGNLRGLEDMGVAPGWLPGYPGADGERAEKLKEFYPSGIPRGKGMPGAELLSGAVSGEVAALYLVGVDPAGEIGAGEILEKLDFLVVQDLFITDTARKADVFLPAASFAEKMGSFTNASGTVQKFGRSFKPIGESREDWRIFGQLAAVTGCDFGYSGVSEVKNEINRMWEKLAGIPYIS
jgi:NADH-quinone oxidoreductase subunit G